MKLGTINSWNAARQVGTIICRQTNPVERYFFFGSRVLAGPEPTLNAMVTFDVDPRPTLPGKLPVAMHIEVLGGAQ